jgi:small subunit ribosomal protein S6
MRLLDNVIRYMTVKIDADINPEARPTELDDTAYERASATAADEEDIFLSRATEGASRHDDDDDDDDDDYNYVAKSDAVAKPDADIVLPESKEN